MPYPLPENVNPAEDVCFKVYVPNDPTYIQNFTGHLWTLAKWFTHGRDEQQTGKFVAERWTTALLKIEQDCEDCEDTEMSGCCPDQLAALNNLYALLLQQADTGTAQSFAPDAPTTYNGNAGQTPAQAAQRNSALCAAVTAYVIEILKNAYIAAVGAQAAATAIAGMIGFFTGQYWIPAVVASVTGAGLGLTDAVLTDENAIRRVICAMINNLKGRSTNQANFAVSMSETSFEAGSHEAIIAGAINLANQLPDNYRNFVSKLGANYNTANGQDDACFDCCEPTPELRIVSNWPSGIRNDGVAYYTSGMQIERTGQRSWTFTGGVHTNPGQLQDGWFYLWVETVGDDCQFCVKNYTFNGTGTAFDYHHKFWINGTAGFSPPQPGDCLKGFYIACKDAGFTVDLEICEGGCNNGGDCTGCD